MSFVKLLNLRRSLAFRLTVSYAALVIGSFATASFIIYFMMSANMRGWMDEELREELLEVAAIIGERSIDDARSDLIREAEFDGVEQIFIRIFDSGGALVFHSDLTSWNGVEEIDIPSFTVSSPRIEGFRVPHSPRAARVITGPLSGGLVAQIGLSTDGSDRLLGNMREVIASAIFVVIAIAAFLGWLMARQALGGVERLTDTAMRISQGDLNRRVPLTGRGDEIDQMADTFNSMVERMQLVLSSMREISDNIAHDLRSPIARIRGRAEIALTRRDPGEVDVQALAADTIEECDRVLAMINTMLDISELETGVARMDTQKIDLGELALDTGDLFGPAAEEAGIKLVMEAETGILTRGDTPALQRALANIVDNALKYTPPGGTVTIRLVETDGAAEIHVVDTGPGIGEKDRQRIFDRFYRGDQSRSEQGNGLGLSLARALIHAHGGQIAVLDAPGHGSDFVIRLPLDTPLPSSS